jgi:hypothetical protein
VSVQSEGGDSALGKPRARGCETNEDEEKPMSIERDEIIFLLKGLVIPIGWDQEGAVQAVEILTDGEGEFEVVPGGSGDELKAHIRREILAEASLLDTAGNVKQVRVNSYAILDWIGLGDSINSPRV